MNRLHAAIAVCACATGCVTANNTPRHEPPPPPARPPAASTTSTTPSGAGTTSTSAPTPVHVGQNNATKPKREVQHLEVPIQSKNESELSGKVELTEVSGGVKVVVRVDNAAPGLHGVHITEFADCRGKNATSAGHHFNPDGHPHALPSQKQRHLGDLGNLLAKAPDGTGRLAVIVPRANLVVGAPRSFMNRALVVHAQVDDGKHPGGNSGQRIGCAELTIAAATARGDGKVVMAR